MYLYCLVAGKVSEERDNTHSTPASHCWVASVTNWCLLLAFNSKLQNILSKTKTDSLRKLVLSVKSLMIIHIDRIFRRSQYKITIILLFITTVTSLFPNKHLQCIFTVGQKGIIVMELKEKCTCVNFSAAYLCRSIL